MYLFTLGNLPPIPSIVPSKYFQNVVDWGSKLEWQVQPRRGRLL